MTIPDFQRIMLPLLRIASDGKDHFLRDAVDQLAEHFSLSDAERSSVQPSGQGPTFYKRVGWARTYLKKAGLLEDPKRAYFRITPRGSEVLVSGPGKVDMAFLTRFPEYLEFRRTARAARKEAEQEEHPEDLTPEETLQDAYLAVRSQLADDLLTSVMNSSASFFEKLVVHLLARMGYGGSVAEAARAVGRSGDEGIDGVIDEDKLGLDSIYLQAKRWKMDTPVRRPEIQKFVGALQGKRAKKGVFITTSRFTDDAREYAEKVDTKVVLIDGERLADLMIDFDVGVSPGTTYQLKSLDSDFFEEV